LVTGIDEQHADLHPEFSLNQNYPNPFNGSTVIRYTLPADLFIQLTVSNALGQRVAQLVNEHQPAGPHVAVFSSSHLASGIYYYTLQAGGSIRTRTLVLLR
jgi:hypothetical protein